MFAVIRDMFVPQLKCLPSGCAIATLSQTYVIVAWDIRQSLATSGPFTSSWPHLRCDVGLEEGEYKQKLPLCYSIVYYYNGVQRYEQFLQVG